MAVALSGCENLLDTENLVESNTANFPSSLTDADMLVTAMYSNLNHTTSGAGISAQYLTFCELASDDRYGGGYAPGQENLDHMLTGSDTDFDNTWKMHYKGVYLANTAIEGLKMMEAQGGGSEQFNQMLGEAYFMRAFYYYELAELFGDVPLITSTTENTNAPRTEAAKVYGQMGSDLLNAINLMSDKPYNAFVPAGHATRWAAEALLARVWLFYTGFYQKESMPANAELSAEISKADVVKHINDCVENSGHNLVGDFRNLWPYTNQFTVNDYAYTAGVTGVDGQPLLWAGNGNCEEVFAIKFCNFAGYEYEGQEGYSNMYVPHFGFGGSNDAEQTFPFGDGNGVGPVTYTLWDEWKANEPSDLRRQATILSTDEEFADRNLTPNSVMGTYDVTGLWGKKMMPVLAKAAYDRQGSWTNAIFWAADPAFDKCNGYTQPQWGGHYQDLMIIRFADVLLMQSELTGDATGMNRVRQRVGLPAKGYSLEALQQERRHELALEGTRWSDIRRWHIAEQALEKQNGVKLNCAGADRVMRNGKYAERYKATQGFVAIPLAQIQLSNGVLTQNAGWEGTDARFTRWENFE